MKNYAKGKRFLAVLLMVMVFASSIMPSMEAQAASIYFEKKISFAMYPSRKNVVTTYYRYIQNPTSKGKVSQVKSSNKSVVEVKKADHSNSAIGFTPKKPGTAKVTFKYAGKKYTTTVTVKNWENPCKTFKLGNKDYASKFNISGRYHLNGQKKDKTVKVNIAAKKGWVLKKITNNFRVVKNKSKVKLLLGDTGSNVEAQFKNKKTGEIVTLVFGYTDWSEPSGNFYY